MYHRDNRKDFCEFKVLKSLVWLAKEVLSCTNSLHEHFIVNKTSIVYGTIQNNPTAVYLFWKDLNKLVRLAFYCQFNSCIFYLPVK